MDIGNDSSADTGYVETILTGKLSFRTAGTERINISNSGNTTFSGDVTLGSNQITAGPVQAGSLILTNTPLNAGGSDKDCLVYPSGGGAI